MGSKKLKDSKNVRMQGHDVIEKYFQNGAGSKRKKHLDKREGNEEAMATSIYARKTSKDYRENWNRYCDSMKAADFRVDGHRPRTLEEAAQYMPQYLEELQNRPGRFGNDHLSAWTIRAYFAAPAKVLGLHMQDYSLPERRRQDVQRSRNNWQQKDFSMENNKELVEFQRCVGLRNFKELQVITGKDLTYVDGQPCVYVKGKGGRERNAPIVGTPEEVQRIVNRMNAAGSSAVWPSGSIPKHYDCHGDRAYYACKVYLQHARPVASLSRSDRYSCRGDQKGTAYDRQAMKTTSLALGHTRESVIAESYLWRLEEVAHDLCID